MSSKPLLGFGFWRSLAEPLLPDPAWFVDAHWAASERQMVLAYLRQGRPLQQWMGQSWCRLGCGNTTLGSADLTDGTYCWPEGLAHYLEQHQLRLPAEIIHHIRAQSAFPSAQAQAIAPYCPVDNRWWLTQRGWLDAASDFSTGSAASDQDLLRRHERNLLDYGPESEEAQQIRRQLLENIRRKWQQ
ncbi:hypothetical protein [Hymenobacter chitinivorans]|uniref:Uncharacterized protein n=1 Tax=Hymenobacter chitinivorans DSM 11115 TaxID=1121954 RepID=A0A2M9BMB3_9BACT|nr:hypothetical protein [Hymenobacter chitinivorans]PJJ59083.1 hypothetical protein CLV45_0496 [Hymenobacter chitinivorans DSM 11115]